MNVRVEDTAERWAPYRIEIELENVSDISVYNAEVELLPRPDDLGPRPPNTPSSRPMTCRAPIGCGNPAQER